jgi:hypothetical protein
VAGARDVVAVPVAGELGFPVLSLSYRFFLIFLRTLLPCARTTVLTWYM